MKLALAFMVPLVVAGQTSSFAQHPEITPAQRMEWVIESTVLPTNILGNAMGAAIGTGRNAPPELGPHWTGFEKRYFNSMATGVVQSSLEAGLGVAWHEDPRYFRVGQSASFKARVSHAAKMTFYANTPGGTTRLAYARFIAIPAANAISDSWRPASETDFDHFAGRVGLGFAGHFGGNLWTEFWPDVKKKVFHTNGGGPFAGL